MTQKTTKQTGTALHLAPKRTEAAKLKAQVFAMAEEVFDRYVAGESFSEIAESLAEQGIRIQGWKLRSMLMDSPETSEQYKQLDIIRSHNLVDETIALARKAARIGDSAGIKAAIDTHLKVAAKLNHRDYGDKSKMELTGKDGNALEIKADLSLTAEQAYERLIKGQ